MEIFGARQVAAVRNDPDRLNETFSSLYFLTLITSAISFAAYVFLVLAGTFDGEGNRTLAWILGLYVLSNVFNVRWLFQGLELFHITVTRNTIIRILTIVSIFSFVKTRSDVAVYALIHALLSYFICELSLFVMAHRYIKFQKPDFSYIVKQLRPLLILFIPYAANILLRHVDKLMLGRMSTMQQTGYYENTDKIYTLLVVLVISMGTVLMPHVTSMSVNGKEKDAQRLVILSTRLSLISSTAVAFGVAAIAQEFIPLFLGDEFLECIVLVQMIAPTIVLLALSSMIRKTWILPKLKTNIYLVTTVSALLTNIICNSFLIPKYAARGAVAATLIAETVVVAVQFVFLHKELDYKIFAKDLAVQCVIGAGMFLAVRAVAQLRLIIILQLAIEVLTGAIVYLGASFLWLHFSNDSLGMLIKQLLFKKGEKRCR